MIMIMIMIMMIMIIIIIIKIIIRKHNCFISDVSMSNGHAKSLTKMIQTTKQPQEIFDPFCFHLNELSKIRHAISIYECMNCIESHYL